MLAVLKETGAFLLRCTEHVPGGILSLSAALAIALVVLFWEDDYFRRTDRSQEA